MKKARIYLIIIFSLIAYPLIILSIWDIFDLKKVGDSYIIKEDGHQFKITITEYGNLKTHLKNCAHCGVMKKN